MMTSDQPALRNVLLWLQRYVPGIGYLARDRAERERVLYERWAPCPIRLLLGRLIADGWTVAVPFPIPDRCFDNTCRHDGQDAWAVGYARRAERLVRLVEDGRATQADLEPLVTAMYEEARARGVTA
jgi:hypothetical protein